MTHSQLSQPVNLDDPTVRVLGSQRMDRAQQVRDVALSMFVHEGFANVSLRHLGKRVGVHAGSLYNHVESKQALLFELIHEHLEGLVETVEQRTRKPVFVVEKLKVFVSIHLEFQLRQQECAQLLTLELRSLDASHKTQIKPLLERYRTCLAQIITAGIRSGVFADQHVHTSVSAVLSLLSSVACWFREGQQQPMKQLIKQMTEMITGALSPPRR